MFFFLQLFNEINCRKVGNRDFDVFESFFHNFWYTLVLFGTGLAHILFQLHLPGIFEYQEMKRNEWGGCICAGSTVILIGALLKLIPAKEAKKLNKVIKSGVNEDKEEKSEIVAKFKKANVPQDINHDAMYQSMKNKAGQVGTTISQRGNP